MLSINPLVSALIDSATGDILPTNFQRPVGLAPSGKPIEISYDLEAVADVLNADGYPDHAGLFRYAPLLPVAGVPPGYADDVGRTATTPLRPLSDRHAIDLWIKSEASNPSGSFKDRGLAVAVALGAACGAARFCLPTQGNAGIACALFSARLGLPPALVYMPDGYQNNIYHRACAFFGGEVRFHGANIAEAGRHMRDTLAAELERGEYVDMSTFFEPGRLEGKKTLGLEIFETFGADDLPDWILYPTGGGTGLVGIWKAFAELVALGHLPPERLPKMVAVQSEQCAPVVTSFAAGHREVEPVQSRGTIADGLNVPAAIMGHRILALLRESGGTAVAVGEAAIRASFGELGRLGCAAGYETAALVAALEPLCRERQIAPGAKVLLLSTSGPAMALGEAPS